MNSRSPENLTQKICDAEDSRESCSPSGVLYSSKSLSSGLEKLGFQLALVVKNLPASGGDTRDVASTLGSGKIP